MDLYILTSALDRSAAAITSASVVTPIDAPDGLPQLVLGTTEPVSVRHLSAASTYETWSYDPAYTIDVALGQLTAAGLDSYASATLGTVITLQGKSGNLALTSAALVEAYRQATECRRGLWKAVMTLQVTATDSGGAKRVFAQLPIWVVGTVPTFTAT